MAGTPRGLYDSRVSTSYAILADRKDLAPFVRGREDWVSFLLNEEPRLGWNREDFGVDSPGILSFDHEAGDFYLRFRSLFQEILEATAADVVVLQDGAELLSRRDGEVHFFGPETDYWKAWLRPAA